MNAAGVLLDTGPLVAMLSKKNTNHDRARQLFAECEPPFRRCESVVAEACFLIRKVHASGPADVVALGVRGVYTIAISAEKHWTNIEKLLKKYSNRPIPSLTPVSSAAPDPRRGQNRTFDSDLRVYNWARNRKFHLL